MTFSWMHYVPRSCIAVSVNSLIWFVYYLAGLVNKRLRYKNQKVCLESYKTLIKAAAKLQASLRHFSKTMLC